MIALLLPVVPVVLKIALDFSVIGGFIIAGFAALFLCGRMKGSFKENCQLVNKLYYDGVVDTAPLIGFLLTLPMFNTCATYASPFFKEVIGGIMPTSEYVVCILFAALAILGFFRGPFTLFGCGAATPVSYTHLDVYKRQVSFRAGTQFPRSQSPGRPLWHI